MSKKIYILFGLFVVAALLLAACGNGEAETPTGEGPVVTEAPDVEGPEVEGPEVEGPDTVAPPTTRVGGWLDMIVVIEEPSAEAAVARLAVGEIDIYSYTVNDAEVFETVKSNPDLTYSSSVGNYDTLIINMVGEDDYTFSGSGKLNPFHNERFRQAMNWLVDREYIVEELAGGLGIPKVVPMNSQFPDYARYVDVAKELEAEYSYNPDKAIEVMTEEMIAMGAELVDGKWMFDGEPVEILFLIRVEDERLDIGHYVSNLFDDFGFTTVRLERTSAEASAIWNQTDPNDGQWHIYTAGWISSSISRDLGWVFDFYNSDHVIPWIRWTFHETNNPEYDDAAFRLLNNDFTTMEERAELFAIALRGHMKYASEIMLFDATSFTPRRAEVEVTADLAAAVSGADLWAVTIRRSGEVGGAMTVAMPSILTEPWNAVGGTNWVYDLSLQRAIEDSAVFNDPYTGLQLPQRLVSAQAFIEEGLPVGVTLDWVSLEFVPEIVVPDDAWADWDAENQVFLTVGEVESGRTSLSKYVCVYEDDIFETQWHDGSFFSLGDMVMFMIIQFDQAQEASPIYDEDVVGVFDSFMAAFKGWKIASTDPLIVEYYTDAYALDAEEGITDFRCGWPSYGFGISPWQQITIGWLAESAGELTFNQPKSDRLEVEWMSYIGGPSIDILAAQLETAAAENFIPYAPTLGQFVTEEEAATRWANYQDWFARKGHFYVGNGPYYLERAFAVEGTIILKHNPNYKDLADKWAGYSSPKISVVEVDGAGRVTAGSEAAFDVYITFEGEDYPLAELDSVKFLVFDATGALVYVGEGEAVSDGLYSVTIPADVTAGLETGASRLEVIAVSKVVSVPSSSTFEFVVE